MALETVNFVIQQVHYGQATALTTKILGIIENDQKIVALVTVIGSMTIEDD